MYHIECMHIFLFMLYLLGIVLRYKGGKSILRSNIYSVICKVQNEVLKRFLIPLLSLASLSHPFSRDKERKCLFECVWVFVTKQVDPFERYFALTFLAVKTTEH